MLDFFYKNDIYVSQDVQQATCWLGTLLQKKKRCCLGTSTIFL